MGAVISDVHLAELQSLYPLCRFDQGFTGQQERFILYYMRGMSPPAAATAAGYSRPDQGDALLRDPRVKKAIDLLREREFYDVRVTRDKLNTMLFDAHAKAASTTEEVMAIKELGKLNGLYESDKQRAAQVQVNIGSNVQNVKQIERMDDKQLLELAGQPGLILDSKDYHVVDEDPS